MNLLSLASATLLIIFCYLMPREFINDSAKFGVYAGIASIIRSFIEYYITNINFDMFFNHIITYVGEFSKHFFIAMLALFGVSLLIDISGALGVIIVSLYCLVKTYNSLRNNSISYYKFNLLTLIGPNKAKRIFRGKLDRIDKRLKMRKRAMITLEKEIRNGNIGYLQELSEMINSETQIKSKPQIRIINYILISIVLGAVIFFGQALAEGLIQDLYLDSVKEFLCLEFNVCIN